MPDDEDMHYLRIWRLQQAPWPLPEEEVDPWRSFNLSGENYANSDGSSRQQIIAFLFPGIELKLVPEPDNPHDDTAIAVFSTVGQIGYIPARHCEWIGEKLARGYGVECRVERFKADDKDETILHVVAALRISLALAA